MVQKFSSSTEYVQVIQNQTVVFEVELGEPES